MSTINREFVSFWELMSQGGKDSGDAGVHLVSVVDVMKEGFRFYER